MTRFRRSSDAQASGQGAGALGAQGASTQGKSRPDSTALPAEQDVTQDAILAFLFDREYRGRERGVRTQDGASWSIPRWVGALHAHFPMAACAYLEEVALRHYGLQELLTQPGVVETLEPSISLVDAILKLKDQMDPAVLRAARRVVRRLADRLQRDLVIDAERAFSARRGARHFVRRGQRRDFAALRTIAKNLIHAQHGRLVVKEPWFAVPHEHRPWRVIVVVDQSGSMLHNVMHASIAASVFTKVRRLDPRLLAFDTQVVDLSEHIHDATEALMAVQLGGGTDIGHALEVAASHVEQPKRTLVVLVTDLFDGSPRVLENAAVLVGSGCQLVTVTAMDEQGAAHDRNVARRLRELGVHCASMPPKELIQYIARVVR